MKRLVRLYPRAWRERYGAELEALSERRRSSLAAVVDLIRGLVDAHLHPDLPRTDLRFAVSGGRDLVLVPGIGFRHRDALATRAHTVIERDGRVLVAAVTPDRDGVRLDLSIKGLPAELVGTRFEGTVRVMDETGQELRTRPRWQVGGSFQGTSEGASMLRYVDLLDPLRPSARKLAIEVSGAAGEWHVDVPVEPAELEGPSAVALDVADSRDGITVRVGAVARSAESTALELEAYFDPPLADDARLKRRISGVNTAGLGPQAGLSDERLALIAEDGARYVESAPSFNEPVSGRHRETAVFPALPEVRVVFLEIPSITLQEHTPYALTVAVPGELDATVAGCATRITATRVTEGSRGLRIRVQATPVDPSARRQILYMQSVDAGLGIVGTSVTRCAGQAPYVDVPDPGGASEVTLRGPVITVRGPWQLRVPIPEHSDR